MKKRCNFKVLLYKNAVNHNVTLNHNKPVYGFSAAHIGIIQPLRQHRVSGKVNVLVHKCEGEQRDTNIQPGCKSYKPATQRGSRQVIIAHSVRCRYNNIIVLLLRQIISVIITNFGFGYGVM